MYRVTEVVSIDCTNVEGAEVTLRLPVDCSPNLYGRLEQRDVYVIQTVDHGQIVVYERDRPIETAKNGVRRVGISHSKYGFGELRMMPVETRSDRNQGRPTTGWCRPVDGVASKGR